MRFLPTILLAVTLVGCGSPRTGTSVPAASPSVPEVAPVATLDRTGTPGSPIPPDDRTRIAEAFRLADAIGDDIWPGWSSVPFALLLVTPDREYLVRHSRPPASFERVGFDSLLDSDVHVRSRTFQPTLLATFPFEGIPTVVIGQAAGTGKHSTAWVLTALHEHFHQLQMSQPDYYAGVDALGLARGDQTGMWMLNYAFPYGADSVQTAFAAMARAVDSALSAAPGADRQARLKALAKARATLRMALTADDDRYLGFQMWQEGVARYTELQVARWADRNFAPSEAFNALSDASSFGASADSILSGIRRGLQGNPLSTAGRVAFYPVGAATALLLDDVAPEWRTRYLGGTFSLDRVTPPAGATRTVR